MRGRWSEGSEGEIDGMPKGLGMRKGFEKGQKCFEEEAEGKIKASTISKKQHGTPLGWTGVEGMENRKIEYQIK